MVSFAQAEYTVVKDLTSMIKNADFSADEPVSATICTYDYDMEANGTNLYGQQPVTGWNALNETTNTLVSTDNGAGARTDGTNARAAGVFAYYDESTGDTPTFGLGNSSIYSPVQLDNRKGPGLGLLAVWSASLQYTQEITLTAGAYAIVVPICNTAGDAVMTNLNGFIAEDGTEYLSKNNVFPAEETTWTDDVIMFILEKETKGVISIGYKSGGNGSGSAQHLFADCVKLYEINPEPIIAQKIEDAKATLLTYIEKGEELGADVSASRRVYDNPSASLKDVEDAIEAQKAINENAVTDLSEFFITNPHFNIDEGIVGGITTYDYDRYANGVDYYGMQPVKGWVANRPAASIEDNPIGEKGAAGCNTGVFNGQSSGVYSIGSGAWLGNATYVVPSEMSDGSNEGNVLGFVACWSSKAQYTQHVTIPAGSYTLNISYYNTGGANDVDKNLMGFIADDGTEYLSDIKKFDIGVWRTMQIMFTLDEATSGNFSVGYTAANTGSANMPHFFIDGISLFYVGETEIDPSLFALQAAVSAGYDLLDKDFYKDLKSEFQTAVDNGDQLVKSQSSDSSANTEAANAINGLVDAINANISAYDKLDSFANNELAEALEKYSDFSSIYSKLEEMNDEVTMDALQEYSWDTEKINETINSLSGIIKEGVQAAWDEAAASGAVLSSDLDISMLIPGLTFESNANDWSCDNGNITVEHSCGEVYNSTGEFKVTRTIPNMKPGTYTITTRAFYRTADNVTNYDIYQEDKSEKAFIWAGYSKNPLINVVELATSEGGDGYAEIGAGYVPNNRTVGQVIFEDDSKTSLVESSVKTTLASEGDLNFGICAQDLNASSWVCWYSFQIAYNAFDEEVAEAEVANLKEEIKNYIIDKQEDDAITNPAVSAANAVIESNDLEVLSNAYNDLKANVAAVAALKTAGDALDAAVDAYGDTASPEAKKAANNAGLKIIDFVDLTTAEVKAATEEAYTAVTMLKLPDMKGASDENPVDVTVAITSADFENEEGAATMTGWTNSGSISYKTQTNESFEKNNSVYAEQWHMDGTLDINQTIKGLLAGTYELTVHAYTETDDAELYANASTVSVPATSDATSASDYSLIVNIVEGEALKIGFKCTLTSSTWTCIDNFRLTYYGTNSANAIANVESATAASTVYSVSGARTAGLQKGVNIVKYTDGSVKKVLVK